MEIPKCYNSGMSFRRLQYAVGNIIKEVERVKIMDNQEICIWDHLQMSPICCWGHSFSFNEFDPDLKMRIVY